MEDEESQGAWDTSNIKTPLAAVATRNIVASVSVVCSFDPLACLESIVRGRSVWNA